MAISCDDGDACTLDECDPQDGCAPRRMTLADVDEDFLGAFAAPACATEQVPAFAATLFGKAGSFVTRAADTPSKARRFLNKAAKKLRKVGKKIARARGRRISTECGTALAAVIEQADARVRCLQGGG
jgi:hypothetical protein